ncbi:hypothetical protein [Streptomyces synnematoformans]|uniref:DUF2742 domain-containing protein n=1 Tax=Streptomyces synnematoformans TaxID=415721 RepID=A0ABP5JIB3_9ACTN
MDDDELTCDPGEVVALWAEARILFFAKTFPEYGSAEWRELPPDSGARLASVLEAAELWRRHVAEQNRLDWLAENDPDAWYAEVIEDADEEARRSLRRWQLSRALTWRELQARRQFGPVHQLRATPGWNPVIPGSGGRRLTNDETRTAA